MSRERRASEQHSQAHAQSQPATGTRFSRRTHRRPSLHSEWDQQHRVTPFGRLAHASTTQINTAQVNEAVFVSSRDVRVAGRSSPATRFGGLERAPPCDTPKRSGRMMVNVAMLYGFIPSHRARSSTRRRPNALRADWRRAIAKGNSGGENVQKPLVLADCRVGGRLEPDRREHRLGSDGKVRFVARRDDKLRVQRIGQRSEP